jgi:hypothetical protein
LGAVYMQKEQSTSSGNYSTWLDKPVLLHVATEGFLTALMCMIVSESDATLRIRVADLWDFDIYKEMVLAVELAFRSEKPASTTDEVQKIN